MNLNEPVGGYFELELNDSGTVYHDTAIKLNTGRNAFEYILLQRQFRKIYLPYYACNVLLQPLLRQNIEFEFYSLNYGMEPENVSLSPDEAILYINYFGLFNKLIESLKGKYSNLIIDNSQAFYEKPHEGVPTFYSPRKFFGLPDGGMAFCESIHKVVLDKDLSGDRISHLINRIDLSPEESYSNFIEDENKLNYLPLQSMSNFTGRLMRNIDFEAVQKARISNFSFLHQTLAKYNEFTDVTDLKGSCVPMVYPFLRKGNTDLKNKLLENKIFVATYWPDIKEILPDDKSYENHLVENLIPLPVDQRYSIPDMKRIINLIVSLL